jgi:hypothetical protein
MYATLSQTFMLPGALRKPQTGEFFSMEEFLDPGVQRLRKNLEKAMAFARQQPTGCNLASFKPAREFGQGAKISVILKLGSIYRFYDNLLDPLGIAQDTGPHCKSFRQLEPGLCEVADRPAEIAQQMEQTLGRKIWFRSTEDSLADLPWQEMHLIRKMRSRVGLEEQKNQCHVEGVCVSGATNEFPQVEGIKISPHATDSLGFSLGALNITDKNKFGQRGAAVSKKRYFVTLSAFFNLCNDGEVCLTRPEETKVKGLTQYLGALGKVSGLGIGIQGTYEDLPALRENYRKLQESQKRDFCNGCSLN